MTQSNSYDAFFMQHAIEMAQKASSKNEVPVGAVIVKNNEMIAEGFNCPIKTSDPTAHAEIIALRQASQKLNNYRLLDTTLYVTIEPCIMCVGAMIHARIKRIVFGATDTKTGALVSVFRVLDNKNLNHKIECSGGILANDCGKLLTDFFKNKRYNY